MFSNDIHVLWESVFRGGGGGGGGVCIGINVCARLLFSEHVLFRLLWILFPYILATRGTRTMTNAIRDAVQNLFFQTI